MEQWSTFGELVVNVHYQSRNKQDLIDFIDNVVLNGEDELKEIRNSFVSNVLLNGSRQTASSKIMQFLENQLFSQQLS